MRFRWLTYVVCLISIALIIALQEKNIVYIARNNDIQFSKEMEIAYRCQPLTFFENRKYRRGHDKFLAFSKAILKDIQCFPVEKQYISMISYEDSYGGERTYGGNRSHEGCDLMAGDAKRGTIPLVSMTNGVVKNVGWLKLGGYRIGILSDNGIYYYYAHLDSYAPDLKENDRVYAGQFIGMMGDTGYSEIEGTTGNFPVHLHLGIYFYDEKNREKSVNPFPFLEMLKSL